MAVVQRDSEDHPPENGFVAADTATPGLLARIDGSVLPFLGGFGKYQKQLIVLTWIPALFIGFSQYSDNFLLAQPNNTCIQPLANFTNVTWSHASLSGSPRNGSRGRPVYANGSYGAHNDSADMQCRCNEWTFELHTGLVQNVVTKWSLVCNSAWKVHIAKFSLLVGSIFGYLVFGILADWFGRHPVLIISVLFMLVFGLTVAFSVNVPMFSTLRFFEGFCLAGIILSLYVLRIELCLPGWRFSMTMVASFVMLGGQLLMPVVAYLCRDWQVLQAVIICPLLLMLSYIWIFPESLRWLLATQQYSRSKWIMAFIAQKNRANRELDTENILTELQKSLQKKPKKTCIVKMVGTRNLWKNIVVLCVNSLTGYGIHHCFARSMMDPEALETTMFHNFYADYYTMAGIAVASCLALCPAVGLMGRRGGLLMFMIITALASLLQLGLLNLLGKYSVHLNIDRSDMLNKNFSIAFSIIGMFSSHAVSNLSIFFCAEITPTVIRGGGVGLVLASAGFGMLTAPIMELHNQKGYFLHHIIFACCTLICIICILLLPETRFQPLPETLADGENYTRQPLLPPRKPGEQRLLLPTSESARDYTRVHDTPLHEAAATVVSTMDSAEELTAVADKEDPKDPNGHSVLPFSETPLRVLGRDTVIHASKERLLSSSPPQKNLTDPLLAKESAAELSHQQNVVTHKSPPDPAADPPAAAPASSLISTTPIIEPVPSSTLESPEPLVNNIGLESDTPPPEAPPVASVSAPSAVHVTDITPEPPPSSCPDIPVILEMEQEDSLVPLVVAPLPSKPPSDNDPCPTSSTPPSPVTISPSHTPPSPLSEDSLTHTTLPSILPITDIVHPPETDVAQPAQDSSGSLHLDSIHLQDLGRSEPAPLSLIDCTVSSPIDSEVLSMRDSVSTESNTVNGEL
ncbi:solute carrier family 22 member 23-like [Synchiropus picturatus]